jgi:tellurite resistance protein
MTTSAPVAGTAIPAVDRGLHHLPLPLFAAPMGIGGLALAWREAGRVLGAPVGIGEGLVVLTIVVWLVVAGFHALRALRHPEALAGDLKHPIRSAFAGASTVGLMLVAGGFLPHAPGFAAVLWAVAVVAHLVIGVWTIRGLLVAPREAATLMPPLLIPLVGNIVAPVIGARLGFETVSWALFGLGALLWVLIQPLILSRIATGPVLPDKLKPTIAILLAPPAVGASALAALTGGFGPGPLAIWGLAAFVAAVLVSLVPLFLRIPFALSWWGYTFPAASFASATIALAHAGSSAAVQAGAWVVLAFATVVVAVVAAKTARAAARGALLLPEG